MENVKFFPLLGAQLTGTKCIHIVVQPPQRSRTSSCESDTLSSKPSSHPLPAPRPRPWHPLSTSCPYKSDHSRDHIPVESDSICSLWLAHFTQHSILGVHPCRLVDVPHLAHPFILSGHLGCLHIQILWIVMLWTWGANILQRETL